MGYVLQTDIKHSPPASESQVLNLLMWATQYGLLLFWKKKISLLRLIFQYYNELADHIHKLIYTSQTSIFLITIKNNLSNNLTERGTCIFHYFSPLSGITDCWSMRKEGAEASEQFSRDCGSTEISPQDISWKSQLRFIPEYREYIELGKVVGESLNLHSAACSYQKAPSRSLS